MTKDFRLDDEERYDLKKHPEYKKVLDMIDARNDWDWFSYEDYVNRDVEFIEYCMNNGLDGHKAPVAYCTVVDDGRQYDKNNFGHVKNWDDIIYNIDLADNIYHGVYSAQDYSARSYMFFEYIKEKSQPEFANETIKEFVEKYNQAVLNDMFTF